MLCFPRSVTPGFCLRGIFMGHALPPPQQSWQTTCPLHSGRHKLQIQGLTWGDGSLSPQPAFLHLGRKLLPAEGSPAIPQDEQIYDPESESQQEHQPGAKVHDTGCLPNDQQEDGQDNDCP